MQVVELANTGLIHTLRKLRTHRDHRAIDLVKYQALDKPLVENVASTNDAKLNQPYEKGDRINQIGQNVGEWAI